MRGMMLMHELCFRTSVCMCVDGIPNTDTEGQQLVSLIHDMTILSYRLQKEMLLLLYLFPSAYCCWQDALWTCSRALCCC